VVQSSTTMISTSSCKSVSSAADSTIRSLGAAFESLAGARLESLFLHAPH
jgi:hypothetical protein